MQSLLSQPLRTVVVDKKRAILPPFATSPEVLSSQTLSAGTSVSARPSSSIADADTPSQMSEFRQIITKKPDLVKAVKLEFGDLISIQATGGKSLFFIPKPQLFPRTHEDEWLEKILSSLKACPHGFALSDVQAMLGGHGFTRTLKFLVDDCHEYLTVEFDADTEQATVRSRADVDRQKSNTTHPLDGEIPLQKLPNIDTIDQLPPDDCDSRFCLVKIAHFVSPSDFYIYDLSVESCTKRITDLEDEMLNYYDEATDVEVLGERAVAGMFCVCFLRRRFFRCKVVDATPPNTALVRLIDWGETTTVEKTALAPLLERFCQLPAQAIPAAFNELAPVEGDEWNVDGAKSICHELMHSSDGNLWAYIFDMAQEDERVLVDLMVTTDDGERSVFFSGALIRDHIARSTSAKDDSTDDTRLVSFDDSDTALDALERELEGIGTEDDGEEDDPELWDILQKQRNNHEDAKALVESILSITTIQRQCAVRELQDAVVPAAVAEKVKQLNFYENRLSILNRLKDSEA